MAVAARPREGLTLLQRERALRPDLFLVISYLMLAALGIVMVYSASAPRLLALGIDPARDLRRQIVFVIVGVAVFVGASMIEARTLHIITPVLYIASVITLLIVLFAPERAGAQRWIPVFGFQLQPSEFAKVAVILALSGLLAGIRGRALRWQDILRALVVVGIPAVMIFKQPDLGTMLVFGFMALVILFVGGTTWRQLAFIALVAVVGAVGVLRLGALKAYQLTRLTAFLDGTSDLAAANYNQLQSEIAIGSGGFLGKGLFEGTQTNLSFVPAQSTDFIFTAVGEQLGFVGGTIVIALFAVIVWRLLVSAVVSRDRYGQLISVGIASLLTFHVFVNIGMTLRLMPVTGLPLPFLSHGGSSFIAMSLALGLAHSVWMRRSPVPGERDTP